MFSRNSNKLSASVIRPVKIVDGKPIADIGTVYAKLADAITATINHPDVAHNIEQYLAELISRVSADATGTKHPMHSPVPTPSVLARLSVFLKAAHNALIRKDKKSGMYKHFRTPKAQ